MIGQSVTRNSIILGVFAIITTGLVVATANLTKDKIALEKQNAMKRSLLEVMPSERLDNDLLSSVVELPASQLLGTADSRQAYVAKRDGHPTGIIFQVVAPEGYGGSINLMVGITEQGEITGVRVIPPHFETPGLGDAIDVQKSDWIMSFNGKSLANLNEKGWRVKKDGGQFDAFTGATITPRAVVDAVHKALLYFQQHQSELLHGTPARADVAAVQPGTHD
ncbi:electron transport complex subunit RsxG [Ketobacter sp.]|uniref:electron transport complex subunit RsxG n=1 Tax=Ketobacter sp. TaxID=2083498 RepID=UPI000F20E73B|nr:electron transport complex subunit RsxG [Ketobacter sp.]RLU01568.1 MAG: electron transport complex subunit RsxG [Ketobacter sp.]